MKVIFLDVDGVLNSMCFANWFFDEEGVNTFQEDILSRSAIACLKRIVTRTGAVIVLSSSWRSSSYMRKKLVSQLEEFGLSIHSDTPQTWLTRGADITAWFSEHADLEVESYVILDDNDDMDEHLPHLVQTDFNGWGLVEKHVAQAVAILNGEPAHR